MTAVFPTYDAMIAVLARAAPLPLAVADADDRHVLEAACAARRTGLIEPIFVGDPVAIGTFLRERGESDARIVAADHEAEAAERSVDEVVSGRARALMKGHLHTDTFLHPILAALRTKQRLSHVFVIEMQRYGKPLLLTDGAINVAPDLAMKAALLNNVIAFAVAMGLTAPKVALLSAVEIVKATIPSTIDAAALVEMAAGGAFAPAIVAGPLAFDCVLSREASAVKGLSGPVPGDADIVLVPEIVAGNAVAKALEYGAGATLAGIVLGARVPIVLTSRADSLQTRMHSIALAAYHYHRSTAAAERAERAR